MEKVETSELKRYPLIRILKQDIIEIYEIFKQNYGEIEIVADGYKLNDISEIDSIKNKEITDLKISSKRISSGNYGSSGLSLDFSKDSAFIYFYNKDDIKALGVASKIDPILSNRVNRILDILTSFWMILPLNVMLWVAIWLIRLIENENIKIMAYIFSFIVYGYCFVWSYKIKNKKYSLIYLYDSPAPGFFERNKDSIVLGVIMAIVGGIITLLIQKLI